MNLRGHRYCKWVVWIGLLAGCQPATVPPASKPSLEDTVRSALARLSDDDRALAEQQRFCAVQSHERLGSMGVPVKLDISGQPAFLCCAGCEKKALADPKATLARIEQLKSQPR